MGRNASSDCLHASIEADLSPEFVCMRALKESIATISDSLISVWRSLVKYGCQALTVLEFKYIHESASNAYC